MSSQNSSECPTLADVIEAAVIRSLCPTHISQFTGFRRRMPSLRTSLEMFPPNEDEKAKLLSVFPSSYKKKIDEKGWKELAEVVENTLGERISHSCFDWPEYGLACCANCPQCSVFCDSNQLQGAYALVQEQVLQGCEDVEELKKVTNRNPPLLRFRENYLRNTDNVPDQDFGEKGCRCCRNRRLTFPDVSPTPPPGFPQFTSFFDPVTGDSDDDCYFNPGMDV